VLVVTVSHRGDDARIAHRQIGALVAAGVEVAYVAPEPASAGVGVAERVVIRRAVGRRRVGAWSDARRVVRAHRGWADLVLVHDLEAVLPVRSARPGCPVVWDVHEDVAASVVDRSWVPRPVRGIVRLMVIGVERLARSGCRLILAEHSYATRFGVWPVVPNTTPVPVTTVPYDRDERPRVVYVGRISKGRGASTMLELGRLLHGEVVVELIGPADADVADEVAAAAADGVIQWHGALPNDQALTFVDGALAGLCLLDPLPNYLGSMPTKLYEYAAHGVPTIASPLPLARAAIEASGAGVVVDPADAFAVAAAVREYLHSPERRDVEGRLGHEWMRDHHDWRADGSHFVELLRGWAAAPRPRR
jgi:glycosyltransferase involved in cell wall biosynthesis